MLRRPTSSPVAGALALTLVLVSCDGRTGVDEGDRVVSVTITPVTSTVDVGSSRQLTATVLNKRGEVVDTAVTWETADAMVATVDPSGLVTGVGEGAATVTASVADVFGTASVMVNDPFPPGAPSGVEAVPLSHTSVDVTWTDNSGNEDEFRIEREGGPGASASGASAAQGFVLAGTVAADVTSFRDAGLLPGTTFRYRVMACNENGCSDPSVPSAEVATLGLLSVETDALPGGVVGRSYEAALAATGGDGAYTWERVGGTLPDGLTLGSDGTVAGTPGSPGTSTFTVRVTSGDGQTAEKELALPVHTVLEITTADLPQGRTGEAYDETLAATGGDGSYTWSLATGSLPVGLSLAPATGRITGVPDVPGTAGFTVRVTSGDGQTDERALDIAVVTGPVSVTTTSLADAELEVSYLETLEATGGDGAFTWEVTAGSLPDGLVLDEATGTIAGTPGTLQTSAFTVRATSAGESDEQALEITVRPAPVSIGTEYLEVAYPGAAYSAFVEAAGGDGSYTWAVTGGALPDGLTLSPSTGEIDGTAGTPGAYYFTVTVSSAGILASKTYALAVSTKPAGAFNLGIMNVAGNTVPAARTVAELSDALARWEEVITGDLEDESYPEDFWDPDPRICGGRMPGLNGHAVDDMVVMVALEDIDGSGGTLGLAGPCVVRIPTEPPDMNTVVGRVILDTSDLDGLDDHQLFSVIFHEIGHVVGLGTLWRVSSIFGGSDLVSGADGPDPRYEGAGGNGVFTSELDGGSQGAEKIPVEGGGGSGTRNVHWDEGEFDHEIMTGYAEAAGTPMSISSMTIAAVGDLTYVVDTDAADAYSIPVCAPLCQPSSAPPPPGRGPLDATPLDDVLDDPLWAVRPDGTVVRIGPPRDP